MTTPAPGDDPASRLIFALDVPDGEAARRWVDLLRQEVGLFKVGLQLFAAEGPRLLERLARDLPGRIFLDLKFHDIPATVAGAAGLLCDGVRFTTVHCDQGPKGLRSTVAAIAGRAAVLGVTVLTSAGPEDLLAVGIAPEYAADPARLVVLRAQLAQAAGCQGVVCAAPEARVVKAACGPDFLVVCPGIRPAGPRQAGDDQRRIMSPSQAMRAGADYLVVGRPIRGAADPAAAARSIVADMARGLASGE
ncbi:MAG: orotidine-5'-phosphate decarboxylase [Deltaproteobacteria bacterium]|nr:orotidine-5'-phosphate decarboxylase [Deltaproteobacteria bacterium]